MNQGALREALRGTRRRLQTAWETRNVQGQSTPGIRRRRQPPRLAHYGVGAGRSATAIDVARFGLLSVVAFPFSVWIARFSYDYAYRVDLCKDALERDDGEYDDDDDDGEYDDDDNDEGMGKVHAGRIFGREEELAEAKALLEKEPYQIIVIAGANEAGKSRFVTELLRRRRNVTSIELAQLVDSVSSLTQVFVDRFGLRWLRMRHMLIDVLPFAGSEILVMKERFSDRDLEQALRVVTEALRRLESSRKPPSPKPVIVIDDLGEGDSEWMRSREGELCLQRLLQWCVYITKERRLAHVILTGNEELVFSLAEHNRKIRGHVKVIGLRPLGPEEAAAFVAREWPGATPDEVRKLTGTFGGWIHDLRGAARDAWSQLERSDGRGRGRVLDEVIKARLQLQMERITSAFARGSQVESCDEHAEKGANSADAGGEHKDPYLDPLKSSYSERANQPSGRSSSEMASWTPLQLWRTLHRIVESDAMAVPFTALRDDVFDGRSEPILDLMKDDVLGFQVGQTADMATAWYVTPATPVLGRAFQLLLAHGDLGERFRDMEKAAETREKIREVEAERVRQRREGASLERRKASLRSTLELGRMLGRDDRMRRSLVTIYDAIVSEEVAHEARDRALRRKLDSLRDVASLDIVAETKVEREHDSGTLSMQRQLKSALLAILAREDPSLSSLKESGRLSRLEAAFRELDSTNCGALTVDDVSRLITGVTGNEVDLDVVRSLVKTYDLDDSGHLDYEEFLRLLGMGPEKRKNEDKAQIKGQRTRLEIESSRDQRV